MRFAVNRDGFIENVIVANEDQKEELEAGLGAVLEDASIYGLQTGDLWVDGKGWTRNRDGEQYILEPLTQEEWNQYQALVDELDNIKSTSVSVEELEEAYYEGVQSL